MDLTFFSIVRDWLPLSWFSSDSIVLECVVECGTSTFKTDIDRFHRAGDRSSLKDGMEATVALHIAICFPDPVERLSEATGGVSWEPSGTLLKLLWGSWGALGELLGSS